MEKKLFDLVNEQSPSVFQIGKLINDGVDVNCRNNQEMTPLLQLLFNSASKQNVQEIVRLFVENGVDVNAKNKNNGSNALH